MHAVLDSMAEKSFELTANLVDVVAGEIIPTTLTVVNGRIQRRVPTNRADGYIMPGFVDAHIHIESSMLLPGQFASAAVVHGTVAAVSDPHEIANVCGVDGIEMMLRNAATTPFQFHFGAPSCVPATTFETSGARFDANTVSRILADDRIGYLSEVMDFPGVLARDPEVMAKISAAQTLGKPIDGHAPGLVGNAAADYFAAGITTDHECVNMVEAMDRIRAGCLVSIREGSAARNFDALQPLLDQHPEKCLLCSDDKHPDELLLGHINLLVARAVAAGSDPMHAIRAATLNPIRHYDLGVGLLQPGDPADFIVTRDLKHFDVTATYLAGEKVAADGQSFLKSSDDTTLNTFAATEIDEESLRLVAPSSRVRAIEVTDGQLLTQKAIAEVKVEGGDAISDPATDLLKLVVLNRYAQAAPAIGFVRGFGLKSGALASSVAHDSHNIVAVGVGDSELCAAINAVVRQKGGLSFVVGEQEFVLPLPVGGLMSTDSCEAVAANYGQLDRAAKKHGCQLGAPFMTLSFLALLVIPSLKLSDKGLFDVDQFKFVSLFV